MRTLIVTILLTTAVAANCLAVEVNDCNGVNQVNCHPAEAPTYHQGLYGNYWEWSTAGDNTQSLCSDDNDNWGQCNYLDEINCSWTDYSQDAATGVIDPVPMGPVQVSTQDCNM